MWQNYLVIALRLLARNRVYAAINIGGLALGLAGCLLILNYVRYESSYDSWLPESGRVYQIQSKWHEAGQPVTRSQASPFACLGLYSLAAFATERRTKEIGIRKVLGTKVRDIVRLLAWQFSQPVILANLIAWPAAWWAMRDWLNGFDARIALTPTPFALAGLLALAIALATVASHALRAARTNPIHALRYE